MMDLRRDWKVGGAGVLLYAILLAAFLPALRNGFTNFDDNGYVTANPEVQQGLTAEGASWAFTHTCGGNWHPLTMLSHMADCQVFGNRAWGHHLTSILLHAFSVVLVFVVLRRMTGAVWRSFMVALLFGVHPLRVESVAWAAERKDVLSTTFWMLTLWSYARFAELRAAARKEGPSIALPYGRHAGFFYRLSLVFFGLGLMAKPMLVTLPCVLWLLDYWPLKRWGREAPRRLIIEKAPFFLAAAAVSVVTFIVQREGGAMHGALPFPARAANAAVSYVRYLGKLSWPAGLAVFYPPRLWAPGTVALSVGLLAALTAAAALLRRRQPYLLTGWLWFLGTLVPVIGLVPAGTQSMADRYSYIPSLGIFLAVVWGAWDLAQRWRHLRVAALAAGAAAALACFGQTWVQISYWKDSETLFRHVLRVTQDNFPAHNNLAMALHAQGHFQEALGELDLALKENQNYPLAHLNRAAALPPWGGPMRRSRRFR